MKAYVFPGQGSQFPGMGKDLYESDSKAKELFEKADSILGFGITGIMFGEDDQALKATKVTQPAVFIHSVISFLCSGKPAPDMVAGHSLGEFSALVACGALAFEDALRLVSVRALAMQKACEAVPGTMAAIIGADPTLIEEVCRNTEGCVVAANYNNDSQTVISGDMAAVAAACATLRERGAKRALPLQVGGAFHSPLMEPARKELAQAIGTVTFNTPSCPIFQNVDAAPHTDPSRIKDNLLMQLTSPVRWTQTVRAMEAFGADTLSEFGPGTVLQGLVKKIAPGIVIE